MTTEGKVSPLPWVCERTLVVNGLGYEVSLYEHRHEIVRAVNAHDRLVAAIERFIAAADDSCDARPGHGDVAAILEYNTAFTELSAALAAAKGGK